MGKRDLPKVYELHVWDEPPKIIVVAASALSLEEARDFANDLLFVIARAEQTHAQVIQKNNLAEGSTVGEVRE